MSLKRNYIVTIAIPGVEYTDAQPHGDVYEKGITAVLSALATVGVRDSQVTFQGEDDTFAVHFTKGANQDPKSIIEAITRKGILVQSHGEVEAKSQARI